VERLDAENPKDFLKSGACERLQDSKYERYLHWYNLSKNPAIFTYDYAYLKQKMDIIRNELLEVVLHPQNIGKLWTFKDFR